MKALLIGGTGRISREISKLVLEKGWELYLLNRGSQRNEMPEGIRWIEADIKKEKEVQDKLSRLEFDVIADFICFHLPDAERNYRLFHKRTSQYIFVSSASTYQKPLRNPIITESTPLRNPYWEYARNKIVCEEYFKKKYRDENFPVTVVRPSHTYDNRAFPVAIHGRKGSYSVIKRMMEKKTVILPGDGTSLWTLTHSLDFAKAFVGLMGNFHAIGEEFHITSDERLTWNAIYEIIGAAISVKPQIIHIPSELLALSYPELTGNLLGDKANTVIFDNTKIKQIVPTFTPSIRFEQGAQMVFDYIMTHKECQTEDQEFDQWCDAMVEVYHTMAKEIKKIPY